MKFFKGVLLSLALGALVASAQTLRYSPEMARRWLPLDEVNLHLNEGVQLEPAMSGAPILQMPEIPFQDVGLIPNHTVPPTKLPTSWELPPFPLIGPPNAEPSEVRVADAGAPVFQGVDVAGEAPSAYLRPLPARRQNAPSFRDFTIPEAFSRVRFTSGLSGVCQLSLYGGTTSFAAEDAYQALCAALTSKQELQGVGKEAVLGIYEEPGEKKNSQAGPGFADIPPIGRSRPDLVDPGLNAARKAPAFKDVSTSVSSSGGYLDLSRLPRPAPLQPPRVPRSYWVALMYFPEKALTAEMTMDQRMGTPQHLVELALLVQTRVRELE